VTAPIDLIPTICAVSSALPRALSSGNSAENIRAPPVATAARMNVRREVSGTASSALCSKSPFMSYAESCGPNDA